MATPQIIGRTTKPTSQSRVADLRVRQLNKTAVPAKVEPKGNVLRGSGTTR